MARSTAASSRAPGRAGGRELRARGRATVGRLLDAGAEVFAARGFHPTRVDDVVRSAKTSHGTFYLYFADKEDLFRTLATDIADELVGLVDELGPLRPGPTGKQQLHAWLTRFADVYRRHGLLIRAWTEAEIDSDPDADILGRLSAALSARIAGLPGVDGDPDITALALVAMVERFSFFVLSKQVRASRAETIDTLTDVVHASLFGTRRNRQR